MVVNTEVALPQPMAYFGAVKGRNDYHLALIATPIYALILAATIWVYQQPNLVASAGGARDMTIAGLSLTVAIITGIIYCIILYGAFNSAQDRYHEDALRGREVYGRTAFREYVNARYGLSLDADDAVRLLEGRNVWLYRTMPDGRQAHVRCFMRGLNLFDCLSYEGAGNYVGQVPDVTKQRPELVWVEAPAEPRVYAWN